MAAKTTGRTARIAETTKSAGKSPDVTEKKPQKAAAEAARAGGAKKKSVQNSAMIAAPGRSTAKAATKPKTTKKEKKANKQSLANPALPKRRSGQPPQAALAGFAPPEALVIPQPPLERCQHRDLGIVAGTDGPTAGIGVGATDLCEIAPSGEVAVAGDTFTGKKCRDGEWTPSVALHVRSLAGKVQFDSTFGWGKLDKDGWHHLYTDGWAPGVGPPPEKCSQLPAGTVRVGTKDYLLVTRTTENLVPQDSRLVEINSRQPGWPTVPGTLKPASYGNFNQTQISGCEVNGWVYIVADKFLPRENPVWLYRCRPETFTDRDSWAAWGPVNGDWNHWEYGQSPEPLNPDCFGELSLRYIEGKFVLSAFNATRYQIEVHVCDRVDQILNYDDPSHRCTIVVEGKDLPQLYGGSIVPGSTLDRTRVLVSEWVTSTDYPYNVREYEVNLDR